MKSYLGNEKCKLFNEHEFTINVKFNIEVSTSRKKNYYSDDKRF